jgi:uncharacterized protein
VLAINLDTEFRVTLYEQFFPERAAGALDRLAQSVLSLAFEFKAITLFSVLFGAGLAIQFDRLAANSRRTTLLVRRLLVLLGFGLIHVFLIWNGDILTEYAIAGLLILPLLFAPAWASLVAAAILFCLYLFIGQLPLPWSFPDADWMTRHIVEARAVYAHGSFMQVAAFRITEVRDIATLLASIFPRTMALMLFGAWVWRTGLLRHLRQRSHALLRWSTALIGAGLLLSLEHYGFTSALSSSAAAENLVDGVAPIALAFGYAALLLGLSQSSAMQPVLAWFAPVGRMAFTNYIIQSVILTLLFYGFGLGLMGRIGVAGGLGIAALIYAAQSWCSGRWLERHRFGPLEWLWRTLMYGELQQWRRRGVAPPAPAPVPLP